MGLDERKGWKVRRFGQVSETCLGQLEDVPEVVFPDYEVAVAVGPDKLHYAPVRDVSAEAPRIAEIFRLGLDEAVGNADYEWHHDPAAIVERFESGDWMFYGCYDGDTLIGVESVRALRGQCALQCVWGCVDPDHRAKGAWANIAQYNDELVRRSGAQLGIAWAATTHDYTQRAMESLGYVPMGCFVGGELLGGSDGRYYRQSVIWYGKLYGDGEARRQRWDEMRLTPAARRVVDVVRDLWEGR